MVRLPKRIFFYLCGSALGGLGLSHAVMIGSFITPAHIGFYMTDGLIMSFLVGTSLLWAATAIFNGVWRNHHGHPITPINSCATAALLFCMIAALTSGLCTYLANGYDAEYMIMHSDVSSMIIAMDFCAVALGVILFIRAVHSRRKN